MKKILAIDPGNVQSAYVIWDGKNIIDKNILENNEFLDFIDKLEIENVAIEMIASQGMAVGKTVFDTCLWVGRFQQTLLNKKCVVDLEYRSQIKMHICNSMRAKDSNICIALVDRFGGIKHGKYGKGTKKDHGFFFGFAKDMWAAFAVAVYWFDNN